MRNIFAIKIVRNVQMYISIVAHKRIFYHLIIATV